MESTMSISPVEGADEHVPAHRVPAEPELAVGSLGQADVGGEHLVGEQLVGAVADQLGEQRRGQRQHHQDDQHDGPGHGRLVLLEAVAEQLPGGAGTGGDDRVRRPRFELFLESWCAHVALPPSAAA
jgi:hypothetical protein